MSINKWADAYLFPESQRHLECRAIPLDFQSKDLDANVEELKFSIQRIFLASQQVIATISQILAIGQGHANVHYSSPLQVVGDTYKSNPWGAATSPAVLLTGLAGVGKSECLHALKRLLNTSNRPIDMPMHKNMPHVPAWFMSLRDSSTINSLLRPHLELPGQCAESLNERKSIRVDNLLELARRASRRDGTCLAFLDELQFQSLGSQANTRVTSMLLSLLSLGPKLIYVSNFSLVHKLKSRRQEDRQRLLAHPIVLGPEPADSACFQELLTEYFSVRPDDFALLKKDDAELIHRYTFGIKRSVVSLLCLAWRNAKASRGLLAKVGLDDLKLAYHSQSFYSYREDCEDLWRWTMGETRVREDLINPFGADKKSPSNVVTARSAVQEWKRQVATAHVHDTMTPNEKSAERDLVAHSEPGPNQSQKVVRIKRNAATKQSMLEALEQLKC